MSADHDLARYVEAQDAGGTWPRALAALKAGRKQSHWMWFVFPQIAGLGFSSMAVRYAIGSLAEAEAYLAHPVLGPRLREGVAAMNGRSGQTAREILGSPDDLKFRSCLTLFAAAGGGEAFGAALSKYYDGEPDPETLRRLG